MKKAKKSPKKATSAKKITPNSVGITPLGDRVLIKRSPAQEVTSFGIIVPDTAKEKSEQGVVVAVGPGRKTEDGKVVVISLKVGDKVQFSYGDEIKIKGEEYILVREDNILAVIQ